MFHQVQFDHLKFLEVSRKRRETKAKAFFSAVQAANVDTSEQTSPPFQVNSTGSRDLGLDKVSVEVLDQKGPRARTQQEGLVNPKFGEAIDRVIVNNFHEMVIGFAEDFLVSGFIEVWRGRTAEELET